MLSVKNKWHLICFSFSASISNLLLLIELSFCLLIFSMFSNLYQSQFGCLIHKASAEARKASVWQPKCRPWVGAGKVLLLYVGCCCIIFCYQVCSSLSPSVCFLALFVTTAVAKELGLRSEFLSPDDELASVLKPCKTTEPQLFGWPLVRCRYSFIVIKCSKFINLVMNLLFLLSRCENLSRCEWKMASSFAVFDLCVDFVWTANVLDIVRKVVSTYQTVFSTFQVAFS